MEGRCDHEYFREHGYPEYCPYDAGHHPCPNYKKTGHSDEVHHRPGRKPKTVEAEEIPYRTDVSKPMEYTRDRRPDHEEVMEYSTAVKEYMKDYMDDEACEGDGKGGSDEFDPKMSKEHYYRKYIEMKRLYDACALRRRKTRRARVRRRRRPVVKTY
jgi:hypothetical protein